MKIIICLSKNIYSAKSVNLILPALLNCKVKFVFSSAAQNKNLESPTLNQLKSFERDDLIDLFREIDAKKLKNVNKFLTFNQMAELFGDEMVSYNDINSIEALNDFRGFAPDLIISIRFAQIFKNEIISIPKYGIINLHSGILPDFRGAMPSFWAILKQREFIGTTLHYINNSKIDVGDIIDSAIFKVNYQRSLVYNINQIYDDGCAIILKCLKNIQNGAVIKSTKQSDIGEGSYFSFPKESDIQEFKKIMPLFDKQDREEIFSAWSMLYYNP